MIWQYIQVSLMLHLTREPALMIENMTLWILQAILAHLLAPVYVSMAMMKV